MTNLDPTQGPKKHWAVGPHLLPDLSSKLVRMDFRQIPGQRDRPDLLTQLLSKGLPMRCQIRELGPFLARCVQKDRLCMTLLLRAALCSLGGLYDHCTRSAPAALLFGLTGLFYLAPETGAKWFSMDSQDLRRLWLLILQEYIVYAVSLVPCLHAVLRERKDWAIFSSRTVQTMNSVRSTYYETGKLPDLDELGPKTADTKLPPIVMSGPAFHTVLLKCANRVWGRGTPAAYQSGVDLVALQEHLICTYHKLTEVTGFLERLRAYGISEHIICRIAIVVRDTHGCSFTDRNTGNLEGPLQAIMTEDIYAFAAFHQEIKIIDVMGSTSVFQLPQHIFEQQVMAVHEANVSNLPVTDVRLANVMFCTCCGSIKNSIAGGPNGDEHEETYHNSAKVVYDHALQRIVCNSGHSSRSTEYKAERQFMERKPVRLSSLANLFEVTNRTKRCQSTAVSVIPMMGNLLQHKNRLYTICCKCSRLMVVTSLVTDPCTCCQNTKVAVKKCELCNNRRSDLVTRFVWCTTFSDIVQARSLCSRCNSVCNYMEDKVPNWCELKQFYTESECRRITRPLRCAVSRAKADRSSGS